MTPLLLTLTVVVVFLTAAVIIVAINAHKKVTAVEDRMKAMENVNAALTASFYLLSRDFMITTKKFEQQTAALKSFSTIDPKNRVFN